MEPMAMGEPTAMRTQPTAADEQKEREAEPKEAKAEAEPGVISGTFDGWEEPSEPLGPYLLRSLRRLGDFVVLMYPFEEQQWTANEVAARAEAFAHALKDMGVGKGDHVVFVCDRHPDNIPLLLATLLTGAAWAPVADCLDQGDIRRLLGIIQPKVVLSKASAAASLEELTGDAAVVVLGEGDAWAKFEQRAADAEGEHVPFDPPPLEDLRTARAMLLGSSGTTGVQKVVVHTHYSIHASLCMFRSSAESWLRDAMFKKGDIALFTSPAYRATGAVISLPSLDVGYTVVHGCGCTPKQCLELIEKYKATVLSIASNFVVEVAKEFEVNRAFDLSSVREMFCGGSPMGKELEEYLHRVLGFRVNQVFGMTELNSGTGFSGGGWRKFGSVGTCAPFIKCKVVDPESGKAVARNEKGELRFKGPTVMAGYLHDEEATKEAFDEEGWLRSGDIGYADDDGDLYITGRIKDIMKCRGMQVPPTDVEDVLYSSPDVLECAVVGVPHTTEQEMPRAYVVLRKDATTTADDLKKLVEENLAEYKWLRGGVAFLDSLPKTASGKINRRRIREEYVLEGKRVSIS